MSSDTSGSYAQTTVRAERDPQTAVRQWDSRELLGRETEVIINHGDVAYRLRCTSNGKLLLTK